MHYTGGFQEYGLDTKRPKKKSKNKTSKITQSDKTIENRIYTRGEFRESLGMNFFSPFKPEREFNVK